MSNSINSKIIIRTRLEKEEFIRVNKVIQKMNSKKIKWIAIFYILLFVMVTITLFVSKNESDIVVQNVPRSETVPPLLGIINSPIIGVVVFILIILFIKIYSKNVVKKHYESNKLLQEELQFTFDDIGIDCKSERGFTKLDWTEVFKAYISKEFFVIYISNMSAWFIPKRDIESQTISDLTDIIKTKIDKKKVKVAKY